MSAHRPAGRPRAYWQSAKRWYWPALALLCALVGISLRLAEPERALPWYDEFRTLLHASGHSYDDLDHLRDSARPLSARDVQRAYLSPQSERGFPASMAVALEADPQVSPLYYGLVRLAFRPATPPLASARWVSALGATLLLPGFFWLCWEAFAQRTSAWIGLALVSLSPAQLYWAFEARPYSWWAAGIAFATAALLHASRKPSRAAWLAYSACTALMIHCHLFSSLVLLVHLAFVLVERRSAFKRFAWALASALLIATPWLLWCVKAWSSSVAPSVNWLNRPPGPEYWGHLSYAFGHGAWFPLRDGPLAFGAGAAATLFILQELIRKNRRGSGLLILALFFAIPTLLAVLDLAFGGIRLSVVRYVLPSSLALLLAFAWYFGRSRSWLNCALASTALALALVGAVKTQRAYLPEGKWRTEPAALAQTAQALAHAPRALLVSLGQVSFPATLSLVVDPRTRFSFVSSEQDFADLERRERAHQILILATDYAWYYEPRQREANALFQKLARDYDLQPVGPSLFLAKARAAAAP